MQLRRWLRILHRDTGFLAVGLSLVFGISGLALNHIHQWNSNYRVVRAERPLSDTLSLAALVSEAGGLESPAFAALLARELQLKEAFRSVIEEKPGEFAFFFETQVVRLDFNRKLLHYETVTQRRAFFEMNLMHLNRLSGVWTAVSDVFAGGLIFLAVSGLFLLPGGARRKWLLVAAGVLVPLVILFVSLVSA